MGGQGEPSLRVGRMRRVWLAVSWMQTWELRRVGLRVEVWGGARRKGEGSDRHKQVVWNGGSWRVLGLPLDRQRPHNHFLRLQTLNPCQVHADKVCQWVEHLRHLGRRSRNTTCSDSPLTAFSEKVLHYKNDHQGETDALYHVCDVIPCELTL